MMIDISALKWKSHRYNEVFKEVVNRLQKFVLSSALPSAVVNYDVSPLCKRFSSLTFFISPSFPYSKELAFFFFINTHLGKGGGEESSGFRTALVISQETIIIYW